MELMNVNHYITRALLLCSFLLSGCALPATKVEVSKSQRDISDIRSLQATQTARMATLESQVRELAGRLDEIEHSLGRRVESELADLRQILGTMQSRMPPPALVPQKFLEEDEGRAQGFPEEVAQPLAEVFMALRAGNYSRAREAIVLAEQFARGSYQKEIQFWKAITLEGLGDYRTALSIYHELVVSFPKDSRAPAVLLRQAQVLIRLGDEKTAALILKKLMAEWPKSSESTSARDRLKELK